MAEAFDIATARQIAEAHMVGTCEVIRQPKEMRSGRLVAVGEPTVAATYPCRFRPVGQGSGGAAGTEAVIAGQVNRKVTGTVLLPFGSVVRGDDRLRVNGETYEVAAVVPRQAEFAAQERVLVSAVGESV